MDKQEYLERTIKALRTIRKRWYEVTGYRCSNKPKDLEHELDYAAKELGVHYPNGDIPNSDIDRWFEFDKYPPKKPFQKCTQDEESKEESKKAKPEIEREQKDKNAHKQKYGTKKRPSTKFINFT